MKEILIYLFFFAVLGLGLVITFDAWKFLRRRVHNDAFNQWVAPIISGLLGGCFIVSICLAVIWSYFHIGPFREFLDAMGNLF